MRKLKNLKWLHVILALSIMILIGASQISPKILSSKIRPGVVVAGINIGAMSYDEAILNLERRINPFLRNEFDIRYKEEEIPTNLHSLGLSFNSLKTIERTYEEADRRTVLDYFVSSINSVRNPIIIHPVFELDSRKLEKEIRALIPDIRNPEPASIILGKDRQVEIKPHKNGTGVDFMAIQENIQSSVLSLSVPTLSIEATELHPAYKEENASKDAEILLVLLAQEILFKYHEKDEFFYEHRVDIQPNWLSVYGQSIQYDLSAMEDYILKNIAPEVNQEKENGIISALPIQPGGYATVTGRPKDGRRLNIKQAVDDLKGSIDVANYSVELEFETSKGGIVNETSVDLGEMQLLGVGRSNFEGSPEGRDFNVRKGLNEKMHNILLAPGEEFSYNSYLGPVTHAAGWKDSLAIFGGSQLIPVPGGGLCQTSTTVYRAMLNAGLKVVEKSNHSLYVHYYKKYGDGLDAAIYPGSKDLRFINDTPDFLLIQAYDEGFDGVVKIYGTSDGRSVDLIGPFYQGKVSEEYQTRIKPRWNQIIWIKRTNWPSGQTEEDLLVSTYRTAPR